MKRQRVNTDERGQALILFIFALAVLMGMVALTIDVGLAYVSRRDMMNAADAAVLAGAARLLEGASPSVAAAEAQEFVERNGYVNGEGDVSVSINIPPTSGPNNGDVDFVEVVIEREVDTFFAAVLGQDTWSVTARAVGGVESQLSAEYAIIALNEDASSALRLNGYANITVNGAGVMVNSNHDDAIYLSGNAQLTADVIDVVGGWRTSGFATIDPLPQNAAQVSDPLEELPVPLLSNYTVQSSSRLRVQADESLTIQSGIFIDGIEITGNGQLIMDPGVYILQGGGLKVSGDGQVSGVNVFIYVTCGSGSCPSGSSADIDISGNGVILLSPMTSGSWAGVTIF